MNPAIQSKQLSVGDLFRAGWSLYKENFKNILIAILCIYIPLNLITALRYTASIDQMIESADSVDKFIIELLQVLIGSISDIATVGISAMVEKSLRGTTFGWGPALRHGRSRWGAVVWTGMLAGFIVMLLSLLLIIPGIIWFVYYSFYIYVVALKNLSRKQALDYSKNLVKGQWWRVALIFFLICVLDFSARKFHRRCLRYEYFALPASISLIH